MEARIVKHGKQLHDCKCNLCEHDKRFDCIAGNCECCDPEDIFSLLSPKEFEPPQSQSVAEERLREAMAC